MKPLATKNGFTLVELLLGLAIAAIIGLCVYNMFWQSMKLDDKMRRVHGIYMEILMADQAMTHDLENAVSLDLSGSYPDAVIFDGKQQEFSFLTQTPKGIKRISYFSGASDGTKTEQSMIGRVVNPSNEADQGPAPVEFLLRRESSMADWLNEATDHTSTQIVATGIKKGSFNCQYAPYVKNLFQSGASSINYQEAWSDKGLPLAVSCSFTVYDPKEHAGGLMFKRNIFLSPVASYYHEQ